MSLKPALQKIDASEDLTAAEAQAAFDEIFGGEVPAEDMSAFLLGLKQKGETVDELLGATRSMRTHMTAIPAPPGAIDIVGTGGSSTATKDMINTSTSVALVVAACGVPVAKHGNRAVSSRSGSSDVLIALGINLDADVAVIEKCFTETNCAFLHAPLYHSAMRHVAEVRKKLGTRTIFNLLGPLTNPANAKHHLIGVFDLELLGPMAEVLKTLGSEAAWLAHGHDGLDEITTTSPTDVVELHRGMLRHFTLEPEHAGLPRATIDSLKGGDAGTNAALILAFLRGEKTPYRDIVLFNAAAALTIAGKAADLRQGVGQAAQAVDSGLALKILQKLSVLTKQ